MTPHPHTGARTTHTTIAPVTLRKASRARTTALLTAYGKLPMRFELNEGQIDSRVKFTARGAGSTLFLTNTDAVLALARPQPDHTAHKTSGPQPRTAPSMLPAVHAATPRPMVESAIRLRFIGANPHAQVIGLDRLPGTSNYFIGNDRRKWRTNVPSYARVEYRDLYPGIDLVYYGNQGHLEYDLVVKPGAKPGMIKLAIAGAAQPHLDTQGNLMLSLPGSVVRQAAPVVYQQEGSVRHSIRTQYNLLGKHMVSFTVGLFNRRRPLIIDPVLSYSTYLGGSNGQGFGGGIAVDATGNAYVTGTTGASDFPTTPGAFEPTFPGYLDNAFVTKLNPTGSALVYSTFLSGSNGTYNFGGANGQDIAVDATGNAYVTGTTGASDFPTTPSAFEPTFRGSAGDNGDANAFVTKLNAGGSALIYSTYLGGSDATEGHSIAVDATGDAYVTGMTDAPDFPTTLGVLEPTCPIGFDAFVTKLNAGGSALVYSTYLGGGGSDSSFGNGIAVDATGDAYVTGMTDASGFPTTPDAFAPTYHGGFNDAFVTKLNAGGSALVYSTYLGGSNGDSGGRIAVDATGNAYVTGETSSSDFPTTPGAFETTYPGSLSTGFVTKFDFGGATVPGSVSPTLSSISLSPSSAPADGTSVIQVTVTLRDDNGAPVPGKVVTITSSRGGADAITLASATTDRNGQATAQITSLQPGSASIIAVDATDGVTLQQQATVTFSASTALADEIHQLQVATEALLTDPTDSESLVSTLTRLTDYNDALQQETTTAELDIAKASMDAAKTLATAGSNDSNVSKDAEKLGLPGIKNQKLTHILTFVHNSDDNTGLFAQHLLTALQSGSAKSLTKPVLLQGFESYGTSVLKEYGTDQIESAILDQVAQRLGQTGSLRDVFLPAAQTDLSQLQHDVNTTAIQTLNGLPALNDTLQSSWRANLVARAQADSAQAFYEIAQANTVEALKNSATQSSANPALEALFRTTGQALACGAFHALGCKLYGLALDGIDGGLAVDSLKTAARGSSDAILGFNGTINAATNIDQNVVNGLDAIHDYPYTPLDTPKGTISDIGGDTSNQHCGAWHAICTENASGSVLTVKNTGDVKAEFIVNAHYLTNGGAFGMAALNELATNYAVIQPQQTAQIPISYKNGSTGSSPEDGSPLSFDLIAVNDTGTYGLGQTSTSWYPHPMYSSNAMIAGAAGVTDTATSSAPAPDLVSSFVVGNAATTSDDEQVWINNPLTETVTAVVTQTVPAGVTVAEIGSGGIQQGSGTITWTATVPARTSQPVTMTLRLADPTAGAQVLPAASADLIDAEGRDSGLVATDPITLTPLQTLQVESGLPGQIAPGAAATVPYTITNVSGTTTSATFAMTLTDNAGNTVFTAQQPVAATPATPVVISVTLPPTLPIGLLQEDARITGAGIWPATTTDSVLVGDSSPSLDLSGPPSPSPTNSALGYTLTITNTTGQPVTDLAVTATVDGPGTIIAGSVGDGGIVQGSTVTWDVSGSIASGAVVTETLPVQAGADSSQAGSIHVQVWQSAARTLPQTVDAWTVLSEALTPPPSATGTASPQPSYTPTSTATPSTTATMTPTGTPAAPAQTSTGTPMTPTPTGTPTPSATATATSTPTPSPTATATSVSPTNTAVPPSSTPPSLPAPSSTAQPQPPALPTATTQPQPLAPPAATARPLTAAPTNTVGPAARQATVTIRPPSPHATPIFRPRPRPTVTPTAGVPAPCVRPQITRLLVGGKPFKAGMPVASGQWVRVTVHAAPHTHVRMTMTLTGTRVVLVGRGARRKRITRVVTVEQLAVEVTTNGHGDASGWTRIIYVPAQTEAVTLTAVARVACGGTAKTRPLTLRLQPACVTPMVSGHSAGGVALRNGLNMRSGQMVVVDVDAAVNTRVALTAWMYPLYAHGKRGPGRRMTATRTTGHLNGHAVWMIRLLTVPHGRTPVLLTLQARVRCSVGKAHDVSVTRVFHVVVAAAPRKPRPRPHVVTLHDHNTNEPT